ncbi:hypothetical protein [Actinophytocola sp. KF-1]
MAIEWRRRVMSDSYTNYAQGLVSLGRDERSDFIGSLRLDALLLGRLVVPDTHLLDGRFFLDVDPLELAEELRESEHGYCPLEIVGRGASLLNSLATWFVRPDRETLNGGLFNSIEDRTVALSLSAGMTAVPVDEFANMIRQAGDDPIDGVLYLLESLGVPSADLQRFSNGWAAWVSATESGDISYLRQKLQYYPLAEELRRQPVDTLAFIDERSAALANEVLAVVDSGSKHRADTYRLVDGTGQFSDVELHDRRVVRDWYDSARQRAIARQNGCDLEQSSFYFNVTSSTASDSLLDSSLDSEPFRDRQVVSTVSLSSQIGRLDRESYKNLVSELQADINRWRTARSVRALRRVVNGLREGTGDIGRTPSMGFAAKLLTDLAVGGTTFVSTGGRILPSLIAAIVPEGIDLAARASHGGRDTRGVVQYFRERSG